MLRPITFLNTHGTNRTAEPNASCGKTQAAKGHECLIAWRPPPPMKPDASCHESKTEEGHECFIA